MDTNQAPSGIRVPLADRVAEAASARGVPVAPEIIASIRAYDRGDGDTLDLSVLATIAGLLRVDEDEDGAAIVRRDRDRQ